MANDPLTFLCPACGIKLTVPGHLAGVVGPCPTCQNPIQAPYPVQPDAASQLAPAPHHQEATAARGGYKPEPRQLPSRANQGDPVAKPMPEPQVSPREHRSSNALPRHPRQKSLLIRVLVPLLFMLAAGGIVYGVFTFLDQQRENDLRENTHAISPKTTSPASSELVTEKGEISPSLPVSKPEQPSVGTPAPQPAALENRTNEVRDVLDKFLEVKTLADRLPLMETQTPEAELATSCLAHPLARTSNITLETIERNQIEKVVDYYHNVAFDAENGRKTYQCILVRIRGDGVPKVVADPFLDSFGGRLAAYAKTPTDKAGTFQIIIWPLASCYDEKVPNLEKKLTLKLLAQADTKEITLAYLGKHSKIAQMLEDGTYDISYGKAKACTVMLRWNTEDRPETPYLEAVNIPSLD